MVKSKISKYNKFSQENVEHLCQQIRRMEEFQEFHDLEFAETLRELAEVIIWCDKSADSAFDIFLELNMIKTLERVVTNAELSATVKMQVINFMTMLLHNFDRESSIYYMCSNNRLNRMISIELDESDDEFLSIYVSFMKNLALRLNEETVQFFFDFRTHAFPLFDRASKLLNVPDRIVRAAARQIVISIAQLRGPIIGIYMENTLKSIFEVISQQLWTQIEGLAETANWYCEPIQESMRFNSSAVVNVLRVHMEDVVDDLFYINDLLETPHKMVSGCLESILIRLVVDPLMAAVEAQVNGQHSASGAVPSFVALSVITRWFLLNKDEHVQQLLRERLLGQGHGNPCEGLLARLLQKGDMECVSVGTVLLGIMAVTGSSNDIGSRRVSDDKAVTLEQLSDGKGSFVPSWNMIQEAVGEFESAFNPWVVPECDSFISFVKKRLEHTATAWWTEMLLVALHFFITHAAFTRMSVFEASLPLLKASVHDVNAMGVLIGALLFLSHTVIRYKKTVYATYLGRSGAEGGPENEGVAGIVPEDGELLMTTYQIIFLEMEHASCMVDTGTTQSWNSLAQEAAHLLPMFPCLDFLQAHLAAVDGDKNNNYCHFLHKKQDYCETQKAIGTMVPQQHRAAHNQLEVRNTEYLMWIKIRRMAHELFKREDQFMLLLRSYRPRYSVGADVTVALNTRAALRCEFVKQRLPPGKEPPLIESGTPMYMIITGTELLFLVGRESRTPINGTNCNWKVAFAFPVVYVHAAISQLPFKVVFTHAHPTVVFQLYVVFRHRTAADAAVEEVMQHSNHCKRLGAALVCGALYPRCSVHADRTADNDTDKVITCGSTAEA
ncbi:hypothetical protein ERJ75_001740100 [Trypanosoma vivax]|uniref:FPL domain-containing protein n=1 Tax=Trypanosoma vivax (strain Y486) TaxID=1055687 RepID=G0U2X3_TRYVY|nr:hypothetical protein TRVL_00893 [Trypanosoma vivax]KAH8604100.1 hypothetical protein ERJ75_001740100 [Trypanosoma vivax]CCC50627.1 conserved hypothetical protein [Trypanosoma vivax Y486]